MSEENEIRIRLWQKDKDRIAKLQATIAKLQAKLAEKLLRSEADALLIESMKEELDRYKNGYKGGCYACEIVGEKNVELGEQLAEANRLLGFDTGNI